MVYIIMVIIGIGLFIRGNYLINKYNGSMAENGWILILLGLALVEFGIFSTENPKKVDVKQNKADAGIVACVNDMTVMAMNKPSAGIVEQVNSIVKEDEEPNLIIVEQSDIDLLARLMTAEQGYGADERDYYLTGSVVINRMNMERYPNTLQDVIYDDGQYQCVENGHINRPYDEVAYQVAEELLVYGTEIPEDVIYQAEFIQGSEIYDKRDRTYYCHQ